MNLRFFLLLFVLIQFSCKDDKVKPKEDKKEPEELNIELAEKVVTSTELYPDEETFESIYPGSILNLKSNNKRLEINAFKDFSPLPVRLVSMNSNNSLEIIPSFIGTQEFLKGIKKSSYPFSISSRSWSKIVDYRVLLNAQMPSSDLVSFFKLLDHNEPTYIIKHAKTTLLSFAKQIDNTLIMELPRKTELISLEEQKKNAENDLYYISIVSYGLSYVKIVESDLPEDKLKSALEKLSLSEILTNDDIKVIEKSSMTILLRTSAYKHPLLKKAKGYKEIQALTADFNEMLKNSVGVHTYPIYYFARSLKDFSPFSHTYANQFFVEK
ncbi:hypothetical protein [Sphingobacterium bovistauri]|uniref:Thiol-activated cytolysin n=1 Tax=Sphingobacterium bovistauri TaxID=2781959 RepID=A0ABS7Z2C7_9SPHI|nr:hypothetical protein [Sphingobacterium bovistauri]MCA5004324.1 hypothetical protein [Sphingobacterium bovistauri]